MKLKTSKIQFSRKDIERGLSLPKEVNIDLAYLCGVLAGDGNIHIRKEKHDHSIKCVGNPKDEREFYDEVLVPLFKRVFNISLIPHLQDKSTTYGIRFWSKALVKFLTEVIGLPKGVKYEHLTLPRIFNSRELKLAFIQGVADTDFCFTLRNKRPAIIGASKSRRFMEEIAKELEAIGISMYKAFDYKVTDSRMSKGYFITNRIELSSKNSLSIWMKRIGFRSPKHLGKIENIAGVGVSSNHARAVQF